MSQPKEDPLVAGVLRAASAAAPGRCPGAELLALYAEQELSHDERRPVEAHVAGCDRCQATLAAFVRSEPERADGQAGAPARVAAGLPWWAGWRWMAPLASAMALLVVAVWIGRGPAEDAAEQSRATSFSAAGRSQAGASATAPLADSALALQEAAGSLARRDAEQSIADEARRSTDRRGRRTDAPALETQALAKRLAEARTAASNGGQDARLAAARQAAELRQELADAATLGAAPSGTARPAAAAPAAAAEPEAAPATLPGSAREAAVAAAIPGRAAVPPRGASPANEAAAAAPSAAGDSSRAAAAAKPSVGAATQSALVAPGWRLSDGAIERTRDQGASWQRSATPPGVHIVAVAAPSTDVCWAIGANVVIRTINGVAWSRTASPPAERLIAVAATDGNNAVVTAVDGRRFATSDGGASWRLVP